MLVFEELKQGDELRSFVKAPVTKVQLVKYAGASGDYNPLHTDDEFARKVGMPGVVAHGMLVMGFLGQYLGDLKKDSADVIKFGMRFGAITVPGDQITCTALVENVYEENEGRFVDLELKAVNESGKVVGSGKATLRFR